MADAGDTFASLVDDDQETPAPEVKKLTRPDSPLLKLVDSARSQGKQVSFPSYGNAAADVEGERFLNEQEGDLNRRRANEARGVYAADAQMREDRHLVAQYGTTNLEKIKALKSTGALDSDFAARAQMDPDWAKAAKQKAYEISGLAPGASDAADVGAGTPPRTYSVGTGAHGEAYFTNLTRGELHAEHRDRNDFRRSAGEDPEASPVSDLHPLAMRDTPQGTSPPKSGAEIAFRARMEKVSQIAGEPERKLEHFAKVDSESERLLKEHDDIASAREEVQQKLMSGAYGKMGFEPRDVAGIDKLLIKRAKDPVEDPHADWTYYKPWHAAQAKLGASADKARPADLGNPGGSQPALDAAKTQNATALSDSANAIGEQTPSELPRTFAFATMSPTAMRMRTDAARARAERAKAPANPLQGRLESDRTSEMNSSRKELLGMNLEPDF